MCAAIARGHGGDAGGDPPPRPNRVPTTCEATAKPKRKRGMSTSKNLYDAFEANGKKPLPVEFDTKVKTYKPVGRNGAMFTRFIGNMIGHGIPLNHRSWNDVSSEFRPFILRRLREYFILDPTTPDWPMILAGIERECQDLYKNRKGKLKKHFKNVGGYDNVAKARRNPPVHLGREEWDEIVNLFCDSKFKTRSATNAQNRTHVKYSSLHGSISYIASRYKQKNPETKELQGAIDNFRDMHHRPNGGWVNDLARIDHEAMLAEQAAQMQQDGSTSSSINDEAIITKVLGERRGHSRGIGRKLKGSALSSFLDPLPPPSQLPTVDMMKNVAEAINATNQYVSQLYNLVSQSQPGTQFPLPPIIDIQTVFGLQPQQQPPPPPQKQQPPPSQQPPQPPEHNDDDDDGEWDEDEDEDTEIDSDEDTETDEDGD